MRESISNNILSLNNLYFSYPNREAKEGQNLNGGGSIEILDLPREGSSARVELRVSAQMKIIPKGTKKSKSSDIILKPNHKNRKLRAFIRFVRSSELAARSKLDIDDDERPKQKILDPRRKGRINRSQ